MPSNNNNKHYYNVATEDNLGHVKTLQFLKSHSFEYLSGQDLSEVLGISRVAVWKHIQKLRKMGYTIESKQKTGYKLIKICDEPYPWEITQDFHNAQVIGNKIHYYNTTQSTQNIAASLEFESANNGTVIISARQSRARGRANKRWLSPYGGIYMSVILHPACSASTATLFPLGVGVSIVKAIKETCGISSQLKWPNDITIQDKKVAGIITEAELELDRIQKMCIGIGVNFDLDLNIIKKEFANTSDFYGATTIAKELKKQNSTKHISKTSLVKSILTNMEDMYKKLLSNQNVKIITEWSKYSSTIGRRVSVIIDDKQITGTATKIANNGMLVVKVDNDNNNSEKQIMLMTGTLRYIT